MSNKQRMRTGIAVVATLAVTTFGWPAVAGAAPDGPNVRQPARAASARPTATVPGVGGQFRFSARTEVTNGGPASSSGVARNVSASGTSGTSAGAPTGLFVAPQPVPQLAPLIGTNGGVVSVASGAFSSSGHQDVAAVICNPCGAWGQPPFRPSTDGTYSIAVLPGNGDGTFGTPTQLSPVGPNIALSMIVATDLGNGHTDLVVSEIGRTDSNPNQLLVYLGNGDGTFQSPPIAVSSPGPIVRFQVADLGTGHPDLVAMVPGGTNGNEVVVFTGDGKGDFTAGTPMPLCPPSAPAGSCPSTDSLTDLVVAPLMVGGKPDILVSQQTGFVQNNGYQNSTDTLAVFMNNGSGTFAPVAYPVTDMNLISGLEVGDFTGPSGPPSVLLVGTCLGNQIGPLPGNCQMLLRGNGDGTFQAPSATDVSLVEGNSMRAAVADTPVNLTNGGPLDALWLTTYGNQQSSALVTMSNNGSGAFARQELVGVLPGAVYASTALPVDLTGDGQPDLVVGGGPVGGFTSSPGLWVVPANTKDPGTFLTARGYLGFVGSQFDESVTVGDFRNTGHQDVLDVTQTAGAKADVTLLPGNGDGTFGTAQDASYASATGSVSPRWGLIAKDFNGDGKLDIAYVDDNDSLDYQLGNGDGTFGPVVQVTPSSVVGGGHNPVDVVETTLNGEPEIIASVLVTSAAQYLESWLWNPATSAFGAAVVSGPLPAVQGGDVDIAVGHFKAADPVDLATVIQPSGGVPEVDVVTGNTDGSFNTSSPTQVATPCSTATGGSGNFSYGAIAVGNLGNGHDDIVWQCISALYVALGNGDGTFQAPQSYSEPPGAANAPPGNNAHLMLADLEGNGHLDAVAYGGDYNIPTGMAVWHDNGNGTFAPAQLYTLGIPANNNLGKVVTAGPLTTSGTDDLMVLGDAGDGNDDLTVFLTTGGRPALEATQVSMPTPPSPVPGNIVTGTYQVTDTGGAVSSSWEDSVYLAPGATGTDWTDADTLLERVPQSQSLGGGGSYSGQYRFPLGNVPAGTYHLIVVPDSTDVLSGGNETPAASGAFTVGPIPTLSVGSPISTDIQAGQTLFYQVAVSSGADVQVAVAALPSSTGVTLLGQNGQVPTAQSATVGSKSSTVTLPGSSPGTWYVVIEPSSSMPSTPVPITISAGNLGMTLDAVTPSSHTILLPPPNSCGISVTGGPHQCPPPPPPPPCCGDGLMTLTVQGSGFGTDTAVQLVGATGTYTATTVTRRDSTVAFASFPVAEFGLFLPSGRVLPGVYDVVVKSGGHVETLTRGFTVLTQIYQAPSYTQVGALTVTFSAPAELRQGWVGQVAVTLHNNTDTDIAVPVIDVSSPDAVLGAPGVADTLDFTSSIEIDNPVLSANPLTNPSPPSILGAESSATLDLSILSNTAGAHAPLETDTTVLNSSDSTPVNWPTQLAPYQPAGMSNTDFAMFEADFEKEVGGTVGTYAQAILGAFNTAPLYGVTLSSEQDALNFLVEEELAVFPGAPVSGTLYLGSTTDPLGRTSLTLTSTADQSQVYSATTWYDGRFAFLDVPAGTYDLSASGYLPAVLQTVDVSPTATGLSVVAQSGATLTGTVTGADGVTPIAEAFVTVTDSTGNEVSSLTTGADGVYTVTGLTPGQVSFTASADGYEDSSAATATVVSGVPTTANISLVSDGSIKGLLTSPGGGAPTGAAVSAVGSGGTAIQGTVNPDGTFSVTDLPPDTYTVSAIAPGFAPTAQQGVIVTGGAAAGPVDLQLGANPATVTGVVTDTDSGAPIAGATVETDAATGIAPVTTASDGSYTLGELPAGPVNLDVIPPDTTHISTTVSVNTTAGATSTANVKLDPQGTLAATVDAAGTSTPLVDQPVVVVGPSPAAAGDSVRSYPTVTDGNGQIAVGDLRGGTYDLQVPGSDAHQTFTIAPGSRAATVTLDVPVGTVSGTINSAPGTPAAGVEVSLADSVGRLASTATDANGDYSFQVSSSDTVDVIAASTAVGVLIQPGIAVSPGQTVTVPTLTAGTATASFTVQAAGSPVSGAAVTLSGGSQPDQPATVGGQTSAAGTMELANLTPGTYTMVVSDGTNAAISQSVTITSGSNTVPAVNLTSGGSIAGTVTNGPSAPVAGAIVVATAGGLKTSATTASDGTYSIGGLPGGTYDVSVSDGTDAPSLTTGVTVSPGAQATVSPQLATTGSSLAVNLTSSNGAPLAGMTAVLLDASGIPVAAKALGPAVSSMDDSATATFSPLVDGSYTLAVEGEGRVTSTQPVSVSGSTSVSANVPSAVVLAPTSSAPPPPSTPSAAGPRTASVRVAVPSFRLSDFVPAQMLTPQFWGDTWHNLIPQPDPGLYTQLANIQAQINALANQHGPSKCPPTQNPYLAALKAQLAAAYSALNRWQADWAALQNLAFDSRIRLVSDTLGLIGAVSLAIPSLIVAARAAAAVLAGGAITGVSAADVALVNGVAFGSSAVQLLNDLVQAMIDGRFSDVTVPEIDSLSTVIGALGYKFTEKLGGLVQGIGSAGITIIGVLKNIQTRAEDIRNDGAALQKLVNDGNLARKKLVGNSNSRLRQLGLLLAAAKAYNTQKSCPPPPPPPYPPKPGQIFRNFDPSSVHPGDPNEILGPAGDGSTAQYIDPGTTLPYTVFFKNEPTATAPATKVVVTVSLPAGTDPSTLQLTGFGFGQTSIPISGGVTSFNQLVTGLHLANGDDVRASGSYDPATNTITWILEGINPATGDIDGTPQGGFLPPDDAAGDGEGYVSFQVDANPNLTNGAKINAQASIVFDTNAAISTNTWVNTIDATAPKATVAPLPAAETGPFTVSWSGRATASRIATYNVYVSIDSGPWQLWQSAVTATSARYTGRIGHLYQFAATATDLLGNTGPIPATAQALTRVVKSLVLPVLGYRLVAADGGIFAFGKGVGFYGSTGNITLAQGIVGMATSADGKGYWMVARDGGIFAFGDAHYYGSTGGRPLAAPIVGMAPTPDGKGYWLVGADGHVYPFGDAHNYGSVAGHLNRPVVAMAATPDGHGYWLVASDGGIFAYGDARFFGSTGGIRLNQPVVGMAATPDGHGYWLVARDGGIFAYGDARFFGSTGGIRLNQPVVGMAATPDGHGYWLVARDGGIFAYGDARFFGSTGAIRLNQPIVGMSPVT